MTPDRDLWDTITIVIALDTQYNNFDTTTTSLLKTSNKTIDQIQSILQLKEAKTLSKRFTGAVKDIAMVFRDNYSGKKKATTKAITNKRKATTKAITNDNECFNCY